MPRKEATQLRWKTVDSTNVEAVAYDKDGLYIKFHHGSIYRYPGVSRQRAVACRCSGSVGQYVNRKIIPNYEAIKIA